ncbi:vacuolar protein sorting-associated protein 72 homolog [Drosophila grimshawi]|uniref:Vacuolar protein sorting-associated protein 72 homolog n=1 Tax=Drosophila grimshawi TaxID=7222 RepID=B4JU67_DROGR|nr:vacuolar protein sorting-associated protein 72 homolog [Drosophila grimshawi]EDV91037.1 GH17016 [Drosophila grimshawi]
MAASRSRRSNAGNKIAVLLDEEEDDFYKTSYGGFQDEEGDNEYEQKDEEEDVVDSDFSIDEQDEPISDQEEAPDKKRKRGGVNTKAYKEPAKLVVKKETKTASTLHKKRGAGGVGKRRVRPRFTVLDSGRKSIRTSTAIKTQATKIRLKELDDARKRKKKKVRVEDYMPTQEELLEEAKITEEENLKSLEKFQKMELEKKKTRPTKRVFTGPTIRYHSLTMPVMRKPTGATTKLSSDPNYATSKCERTFVTIENDFNDKAFHAIFRPKRPPKSSSGICPITRLPARYFDPVTQQPYYSIQAFKILREAYYMQLEQQSSSSELPELAKWMEWRKLVKENRQKAATTNKNSE